jgi:hypothetical protein
MRKIVRKNLQSGWNRLDKIAAQKFYMKIRENRFLNQRSGGVGRLSISPSQGDDPGFKSRPEHIMSTAELGSPVALHLRLYGILVRLIGGLSLSSSFCTSYN